MKILLINQAFYPDVVSTAQHLTDLALALRQRGHEVTVVAGDHGYDDAGRRFARRETYAGIRIFRVSYSAFGKMARWRRALDFASFLFNLSLRLALLPRQDAVVGLTSPPLVAAIGNLFCRLKGGRFFYWVMDLNPDEAVAAGWLDEASLVAHFLARLGRWSFKKSHHVVVLDRFMKDRVVRRYGVDSAKVSVLPPWAHDAHLSPMTAADNPFRRSHGLQGKFVVMYSGNHSACHPLDTLLDAALRYRADRGVVFYFIGGGSRTVDVKRFKEKHELTNIVQLGYQPLPQLSESLSAADLHVTVMGAPFVGIVHPCKIYGILSVGRPFVFIGPRESPMGDLIRESGLGAQVDAGQPEALAQAIERARRFSSPELERIASQSIALKDKNYSQSGLCASLVSTLESVVLKVENKRGIR